MNEVNLPAIEPVTDEDVYFARMRAPRAGSGLSNDDFQNILEQDRRRVAERQAARTAEMAAWVGIAAEIERLRAEVAAHRKHDVLRCDALMKAEAEVAKLNAACAHRLEALRGANHRIIYGEWASDYSHSLFAAALSTDAGKGWIDATGAVEVDIVLCHANDPDGHSEMLDPPLFPADWAGSRAVIVRKP